MSDRAQAIQQFSEDVQLQITMGMLRGISERLQSEHSHSDSEKVSIGDRTGQPAVCEGMCIVTILAYGRDVHGIGYLGCTWYWLLSEVNTV